MFANDVAVIWRLIGQRVFVVASEIKTYMPEADSTLPSVPKKRKLDNGDMNDAKKIKMEVKEEPEEGE